MKREMYVFLCVATALFFGSCTDLSMDDEEAIKADLPADFDWRVYGEINGDVLVSQIIIELRKTKRGEDSIANCVNILSDMNFADSIYLNYLQCPLDGWNKDEKCTGKYANNSSYTKVSKVTPIIDEDTKDTIRRDTTWQCTIGACWSGGWTEMRDFLPDSLDKYKETSQTSLNAIKSMCQFIPENSTPASAKNYLNNFPYDPYLIEQHYHFFGRSDGRPYKYCDAGHSTVEKTQSLADKRERGTNYYYDYVRHTFCLDKTDQKIYVVQ